MALRSRSTKGPWKYEDEYPRIVSKFNEKVVADLEGVADSDAVLMASAPKLRDLIIRAIPFLNLDNYDARVLHADILETLETLADEEIEGPKIFEK